MIVAIIFFISPPNIPLGHKIPTKFNHKEVFSRKKTA